MTAETVLANARLILRDEVRPGAIVLRAGLISDIVEGTRVPAGAIDCEGDMLAPGLIELHTDNLERHIEPRPGVAWPHAAAIVAHDAELAGVGITTVFDSMRVGSIPSGQDYNKYARGLASELMSVRAAGVLRISHYLHLRAELCSETLIDELAEFGPEDRVRLVSLMDHTPGQRQFRDVSRLAQFVQGRYGLDDDAFARHVAQMQDLGARMVAPHQAAAVAAAQRLDAVLASHDDTDIAQVQASARHGVSLAEFPTTQEAAAECRKHGIWTILGAPNLIRGSSHSGNIAAQTLAEADLLDIVSSDYVPSALLAAAILLAEIWDDLPRAMATVTSTPAAATGLSDRGKLEIGGQADVIRFRMLDSRTPVLRETWARGRRVA